MEESICNRSWDSQWPARKTNDSFYQKSGQDCKKYEVTWSSLCTSMQWIIFVLFSTFIKLLTYHVCYETPHNTSHHLISPHNTPQHLLSPHNTSQHLTTPHNTSQHLTTPHITSQHLTSSQVHFTTPHNTSQHLTTPHNTSQGLLHRSPNTNGSDSPVLHASPSLSPLCDDDVKEEQAREEASINMLSLLSTIDTMEKQG